MNKTLLLSATLCLLAACGNKGTLTLPAKGEPASAKTAARPAAIPTVIPSSAPAADLNSPSSQAR